MPAGVPQGSVLGPLLFLIYINDITTVTQSPIRLFADDTTLYVTVDDPDAAAGELNRDLLNLTNWAEQWLVKFSPPKTVTLNISKKKKKLPRPDLIMDGHVLKDLKCHKHLGLTFSDDLTWNEHIGNIAVGANKLLDIFNAFKYKLDRQSLERLYFTYVRPKLEYACITWDDIPAYLVELLEGVQLRAAKVICGATRGTSHALIYRELKWETLQQRRQQHRLVTMYKIINGLAPEYLNEPMPEAHDHPYNLRQRGNVNNFNNFRTNYFQKSFFPKTISDWNALPLDVKSAPSLSSFKTKIRNIKEKPPDWYYTGDRWSSLMHARIRMLCSPLNDHLFSQLHVVESPDCACGTHRETSKHFLLECPLFQVERGTMLAGLHDINFTPTLSNLLYGSNDYDQNTNKDAFELVQMFIKSTGRFINQ